MILRDDQQLRFRLLGGDLFDAFAMRIAAPADRAWRGDWRK